MNEKESIEKATADAFLKLYNSKYKTSFFVEDYSDSPDIRCKDNDGNIFNLEITLTEDRPKDIASIFGRSDHKSLESLKGHLKEVRDGKANPLERSSCLQGNVVEMIVSRIKSKFKKDYGFKVALVIRDTSPLDWNWEIVRDQIIDSLNMEKNPFDKGIWVISNLKDRIFKLF